MDTTPDARLLMETVRALVRRFSIAERSDVACCGITVAQAATLEALYDQDQLRLGDLCRCLGISASTLTRNLVRLKERGLVVSAADPTDGRASVVRLTANGRRAAEEVKRQEESFFELVIEHLPPGDRGRTLSAIAHLWSAVRSATERCCPGAFDHLMHDPARPGVKGTDNVCRTC
jgi:DNA-binding MarR family transcriptional regulator